MLDTLNVTWSAPPYIYTDGSYTQCGDVAERIFGSPGATPHKGGGAIVLIDPSVEWSSQPIVCIHLTDSHNAFTASSVLPYELASIIVALVVGKYLSYNTSIFTDSQSSMDTLMKPRRRVDSAREFYPLIAAGKAILKNHPSHLIKIKAHPERSQPNHRLWTRHQWGNVIADRVAGSQSISPAPPGWNPDNVTHVTIEASDVLLVCLPYMALAWISRSSESLMCVPPMEMVGY
jgi:hypothetical protein